MINHSHFISRLTFFLLLCLIWSSCINPVEFDSGEPERLLVVDGNIGTGVGPFILTLTYSNDLETRNYESVIGASATLVDEAGNREAYQEIGSGRYEFLQETLTITAGQAYYLELVLPDGTTYQSRPEIIPAAVPISSKNLGFNAQWEEFTSPNNSVQEKPFLNLEIRFQIPDVPSGPFLRWSVSSVYIVTEFKCSPLQALGTCYVRPPVEMPQVQLFSGSNLNSNSDFVQEIAKTRIENLSFGQSHSMSVTQFAHTENAYDYWSQLNQIANQVGSIFDTPPAPVRGNLFNVADEDELVLGYFSGVSVDTAHIFFTRSDVAAVLPGISPYCGFAGSTPFPFPPECCSCLQLPFSSKERPDFWN